MTFTQTQGATPALDLLTTSPRLVGLQNIQLNRTNFATTNPDSIQVYNILSPDNGVTIPSWTNSGSILNFGYTFSAGQYRFKVFYNAYGWANVPLTLNISASGTYSSISTDSSFAGGKLTVTGNNINP
jgi:hypothetical protein